MRSIKQRKIKRDKTKRKIKKNPGQIEWSSRNLISTVFTRFHTKHQFNASTRSSNLKPFQKAGQERMFAKWQWVIASEKQPSARFCPMRIWDAHNTYRACVCVYTRYGFVCVGGCRRNGDQDPHPEHVHASAYGICSLSILRLDMYMHFWMRRGRELASKKTAGKRGPTDNARKLLP